MKVMLKIRKNPLMTRALVSGSVLFMCFAFVQQVEVWKAPESAKHKKNPVVADEAGIAAGKKVYDKECFSCHGKKGRGDGPNSATLEKPPGDLPSAKVQSQTDGELFWKITEGKKPMPATKLVLSDEQRWQVVNYIRVLGKK
jgi:mono/diheme cytochrome c family protein